MDRRCIKCQNHLTSCADFLAQQWLFPATIVGSARRERPGTRLRISESVNTWEIQSVKLRSFTVEPLFNEVLGITNDIFQPNKSVMYGK